MRSDGMAARRHQSWGFGEEIDTPLENLGCGWLRWPILRAVAPLFATFLGASSGEGAGREARESWRGGRPSQFYERRLRLTRSQERSEPCHCRPRPTHDQEEWTNCARACVRAWYGRLYIISSFPRPQGCRRRTLTRKRGLESPPAAGAVSLPLSARFFFCGARTFSFLISAGAALRNPFLPSFSPAVPSFFYLMALRSATPDFQERGTEQLTT